MWCDALVGESRPNEGGLGQELKSLRTHQGRARARQPATAPRERPEYFRMAALRRSMMSVTVSWPGGCFFTIRLTGWGGQYGVTATDNLLRTRMAHGSDSAGGTLPEQSGFPYLPNTGPPRAREVAAPRSATSAAFSASMAPPPNRSPRRGMSLKGLGRTGRTGTVLGQSSRNSLYHNHL